MFIQTEATPNPQTLKFLPGQVVLGAGARDYARPEDAEDSPLARAIFEIDGVQRVFLGADFVTVTKAEALDWPHVKPFVLGAIMEHFVAGRPVVLEGHAAPVRDDDDAIAYEGEAAEIVAQIKELIETRVRPAVAQDGGDITFHSWLHGEGVVKLRMKGSCAGCPSSTMTLKSGIENMLRHYVPEVKAVESVV
jgi:NFU1 iron-sulfur cluster scaffold homolog, mitochondrial